MSRPPTFRTRRLDHEVDLLAVAGADGLLFEHAGLGVAGRGVAVRIPVPAGDDRRIGGSRAASATLAQLPVDDEVGGPGTGPLAFGALPFDPDVDGELLVPSLVVGRREDGTQWITWADEAVPGGPATDAPSPVAPETPRSVPSSFTVTPSRPPQDWCDAVDRATKAMAEGRLRKAVLAREVRVEADQAHDPLTILERLRTTFPGCYVFRVGSFLGATPELLVSRTGDVVRAQPLAGTAARGGDPTADAKLAASLFASSKDREEHRITIGSLHDVLLPYCSYLDEEPDPSIVAVANVQHLATTVEGRLSSPPAAALELASVLHPTPAVGGDPKDVALEVIREEEALDRGRYAGPVGWTDAAGNGRWAVGIRSAELDGTTARIFAGNGILADSDPERELAETRAKLQALLNAIVRP
jgi:menaquinone-specific isochorismate synthase